MTLKIVEYPLTGRRSVGSDFALRNFLMEQGVWSENYIAFSMPLSGNENPSELERRLAETGKVNCDILATGDLNYCKKDPRNPNSNEGNAFLEGKIAIVIYDKGKLQQKDNRTFMRPQGNPSEYVAMIVVPKVQEKAAVA